MNEELDYINLMDYKLSRSSFQVVATEDSLAIQPEQPSNIEYDEMNPEPVRGVASLEELSSHSHDSINESFIFSEYSDDQIAEIIIGNDDRVKIQNTLAWPYVAHGHLVMQFPNNKVFIGSGTIINKHHVITAGHCVFSKSNGGWAKSITFYPAQNGSSIPFGGIPAAQLYSIKGWTQNNDSNYDFGMLILNQDIGLTTGHLGLMAFRNHTRLLNHRVNVTGFPGDKGGKHMWTHADIIKTTSRTRVIYDIDTMGGQSGSGVWSQFTDLNQFHVCAIHTTGHYSGNGATNISVELFDSIIKILSLS